MDYLSTSSLLNWRKTPSVVQKYHCAAWELTEIGIAAAKDFIFRFRFPENFAERKMKLKLQRNKTRNGKSK